MSNSEDKLKNEMKLFIETGKPKVYLFTLVSTAAIFYGLRKNNIKFRDSYFIPTLIAFSGSYFLGSNLFIDKTAYSKYVNSCQFLKNSERFRRN